MEIIGLIPAGGLATRLSPLPFSKELFPLGFHNVGPEKEPRPKPVMQYLMDSYKCAGIKKVYIILRKGKWDIPEYYGDGSLVGLDIGYLIMNLPYGVPFTLNQAYPFIKDNIIAVGFPDILFKPENAYKQLVDKLISSETDITIGLFTPRDPAKVDMVRVEPDGTIREIQIKPDRTDLIYSWIIAVWKPVFTEFMHAFINKKIDEQQNMIGKTIHIPEIHLGHVIQEFLSEGNEVSSIFFKDGHFTDIGNLEDLSFLVH